MAGTRASSAAPVAEALGLRRAGPRQWGYRTSDVDAVLAPLLGRHDGSAEPAGPAEVDDDRLPEPSQLRRSVFRRQRGGYLPVDVDAALARLEDRAAVAEARRRLRAEGTQAWDEHVDEQLELILGRLERPAGRRFRAPSAASARGYSAIEVDALCDRVLAQLHRHEAPSADEIRAAVFAPAHAEDVYEENQVDSFLDALVDLLLALD